MRNLLSWVHPGFSVFAGPPVEASSALLEYQARYITRPSLAMDALRKRDDGTLAMQTPPDPRTGAGYAVFDPLEWIHRITSHIPDPRRHCQRYYGAYSNRARTSGKGARDFAEATTQSPPAGEDSDFARESRRTWARLLRKIYEVDPLLCRCGARMKIVSVITDPRVIDRILRHRQSERCKAQDPFEPRAPPRLDALSFS
jgi:hypothetical protein